MAGETLTILVVDDNADLRELYSIWLGDEHAIRTAADGSEALDTLGPGVDIVLLDRNMPGLSGSQVAHSIDERASTPYVVMVSSMEPDFDITEMPIDGYVEKPADKRDLLDIVDQCRTQDRYQSVLDDLFSLTARLAALEAKQPRHQLRESDEYTGLKERVAKNRAEVESMFPPQAVDWSVAFKTCSSSQDRSPSRQNV